MKDGLIELENPEAEKLNGFFPKTEFFKETQRSNLCTKQHGKHLEEPLRYLFSHSRQSARLVLQSSELGPPPPHPLASVSPPPLVPGEGHTRLRERGWESPNYDEGTYTVVLFIYMYFLGDTLACGRRGRALGGHNLE